MKKYSDPIKFDSDNFKRYLSNRRYLSLRFSSTLLFGNYMISTLFAFVYQYHLILIIFLSIITFINLCISLYVVFTYIFNLKTYQDTTKVTHNVFPKKNLLFIGWSILVTSFILPIILTIILITKYDNSFLLILSVSLINVFISSFNFKNTRRIITKEDKFLQFSKKF